MSPAPDDDEARDEAVLRAQLLAFYQALTAVGLWPDPVPEHTWWVQWTYQDLREGSCDRTPLS